MCEIVDIIDAKDLFSKTGDTTVADINAKSYGKIALCSRPWGFCTYFDNVSLATNEKFIEWLEEHKMSSYLVIPFDKLFPKLKIPNTVNNYVVDDFSIVIVKDTYGPFVILKDEETEYILYKDKINWLTIKQEQ